MRRQLIIPGIVLEYFFLYTDFAIKRQARDKLDDPAATTRKGMVLKLV